MNFGHLQNGSQSLVHKLFGSKSKNECDRNLKKSVQKL